MNLDARLDRLTERHEALTQTVELMAHAQDEDHRKNQVLMVQILESIDGLSRIAHAHERRISDVEGGRG
jgi:hypothetical protein